MNFKKYICTISDDHYLSRGLALIESLKKYNDDVHVFYLCINDKCFNNVKNTKIDGVEFIHVKDIIKNDSRFLNIIPSREATAVGSVTEISQDLIELAYKMSSYFPKYCLDVYDIDHVIYMDADIYFYKSLDTIYSDVGDKSFGIVEHRIPYSGCGKYNVGVIYNKNNKTAKSILDFWSYCVLDPNNPFAEKFGTCGDQKYLELIYTLYGSDNIAIIGDSTGHLAPWNIPHHRYMHERGKIVWENKIQDLVYIHYSNFISDIKNMTYKVGPRHGIDRVDSIPWLADMCEEYLKSIKDNT
jgi:hypothetical protein